MSSVIQENHKRIQKLNKNLEAEVIKEVKKNKDKEKIIQDQDLRASMGGMMDSIAHQWKQPISVISLISQSLELKLLAGPLDSDDIINANKKTQAQVKHLLTTLDEFRSFFRVEKKTEDVIIKDIVESTLNLLKNDIYRNNINVNIECQQNEKVNLIPNEFIHVLINLINNTKDAFVENKIENRTINIKIYHKEEFVLIEIQDNAGGIPTSIYEHIFDANITSKKEGTGIGLYMSKMIIEKIGGSIAVENKNSGACFTISLKA